MEPYLEFLKQLWELDAESNWTPEEIDIDDDGLKRFQRYLFSILEVYKSNFPEIKHGYISMAGIEIGKFVPIAAIGRDIKKIVSSPTLGKTNLVSEYFDLEKDIFLISNPSQNRNYKGDQSIKEKLLCKIFGYKEFIGYMSLDSDKAGSIDKRLLGTLEKSLPFLSRLIADAYFTLRLRRINSLFKYVEGEVGLHQFYQDVSDKTAQIFAADSSVIRIYDMKTKKLVPMAFSGDANSELLYERKLDEGISGTVFRADGNAWTIIMNSTCSGGKLTGVEISKEDNQRLKLLGIHSAAVIKLISDVPSFQEELRLGLGTLSFYHIRPHCFSWRDLAMIKSFSQRIADITSLRKRTLELEERTLELEETADNLRLQNLQMTRVEIVALLTHDLGHKALSTVMSIKNYIDSCKSILKNYKGKSIHSVLDKEAEEAMCSAQNMQNSLHQIQHFTGNSTFDLGNRTTFSLDSVINQIEETMAGALSRNKVRIIKNIPSSHTVFGYKTILSQVFFNLIVNAIEAARNKRSGRPTSIFINSELTIHKGKKIIEIKLWDEGPGINLSVFREPNEIFNFGKTTKKHGTGTGLPVSRQLLSKYFRGSLDLEDPSTARFRISIESI